MWGAVGLLWVALFVGANANLIQDTECPVISHADEFYYLVDNAPFVRVTLSDWQGLGDDVSQPVTLDDCKGYPVGKNIKVTPGECDIECEACDAFDNCCSYKYTLTVIAKRCVDETIENGELSVDSYLIGGSATVTCIDANYILDGPQTVTCESNVDYAAANGGAEEVGKNDPSWANLPSCILKSCGDPPTIENGHVSLDPPGNTQIGAFAAYKCEQDFIIQGDESVQCVLAHGLGDPEWEQAPSCKKIQCSDPPAAGPNGALNDNGNRDIGAQVRYTCDEGFLPRRRDIECERDGDSAEWSSGPPTCEKIQCSDPPAAGPNGALKDNGNRDIGAQARYTCDQGFLPRRKDIECERDGDSAEWSSGPPTCERITCGKPEEGSNTIPVETDRRNPGDTYTYSCEPGFTAEPDTLQVQCILNNRKNAASWSADPPTCNEVGGTDIPIRCPRGFQAIGDRCYDIITDENTWEGQCRECRRRGGELALPANPRVNELLTNFINSNAPRGQVWIGAHSLVQDDVWMSMDLRRLNFLNWDRREPSQRSRKALVGPDCVSAAQSDGKWANECCYARYAAVCEAEPLGQEECNNEPRYFKIRERCLRYIEDPGSFEQQCENCFRSNGQLATALSDGETSELNSFYNGFSEGNQPAWFNLHSLCVDNNYQTIDLRQSFFFNWAGGRASGSGDCGSLTSDGWQKQCCHTKLPAICELNACPKHYVQKGDTCYRILITNDTWEANEKKCREDGAHLAVFRGRPDLNDFKTFLDSRSDYLKGGGLWFGCHDQVDEGVFQSPTLQSLNLFPKSSASGDCCALGGNYVMSAKCCYDRLPAVCSLPAHQ